MKHIILSCLILFCFSLNSAHAADSHVKFPIKDAMELEKIKNLFEDDIAFYWGNSAHAQVTKKFGSFKTSKRTNGLGKAQSQSCAWAMASSLVALRDRARREGGNAVINIVSNIKNHEESSQTEYSCLAGKMLVNVALKGDVVTLAK